MPPMTGLSLAGATAGIVFHHLYARRVEIDFILLPLFLVSGAICFLALYVAVSWLHLPATTAVYALFMFMGTFALSTAGSILIYRSHFHHLKHIPGLYFARLSTFWTARKASGDCRFHVRLQELHAQYGDVVRIGPRLVSLARADALLQTSALGKSTFWAHAETDDRKKSFAMSRDPEDHRIRRRPWELAFSPKHLSKHDAAMQEAIGLFIDRLLTLEPDDSSAAGARVVDVTDAVSRLTFDVTGIVGFGHSFGATVSEGEWTAPGAGGLAQRACGAGIPGAGGDFAPFLNLCEGVMNEHRAERREKKNLEKTGEENSVEEEEANLNDEIRDQEGDPKPVIAFVLDALERGDPSAAPTPEALADESRSMIAAGADTTQSAMTNMLGFVAARGDVQRRLQGLVDATFPHGPSSFTYAGLLLPASAETLGWIDAIIHETLRIQPSAPTANPRVTPRQGLEIAESVFGPRIWIPGDVEILQSPYVIHRDSRWFERPDEFLPERWLPGSDIKCDRAAYFPFHLGKHACIGKAMAMEEMRSVLTRVVLQFDMDLAPGQDWEKHQEQIMDHFTMSLPKLHLTFRPRTWHQKEMACDIMAMGKTQCYSLEQ
ncbi:hypothetical protein PG993_004246 [Apiospora rasikravindrae]|uniref:Cytochrome P450 n=1 Tax=Apiospora rasikravindrae TaxID=990691 RepID=A0ABR1TC90_9PEZI